ncbi:MAG: 16S rRNA (guanine(527)-N(7))-methyltransferase RsmG [Clostridia bacterium]|nr:16S rRNA (guanine(527)-N(7))-methyltransferase RsmG [Clostridia bacterium]
MEAYELLKAGLSDIFGSCSDETVEAFRRLTEYMVEYNKKVNLTRITEPMDVVRLHYLDCAAVFWAVKMEKDASVIDVGTGAGFPGLVMKILRPDIRLCLLDSSNKRISYLRSAAELLSLSGIDFVCGRAEEASRKRGYRDAFDFAVSRAVASLPKLCELCMPFVRAGGLFVSLKGSEAEAEAISAEKAVRTLGGGNMRVIPAEIRDSEVNHHLIVIGKLRATPAQFPRKNALIQKAPL